MRVHHYYVHYNISILQFTHTPYAYNQWRIQWGGLNPPPRLQNSKFSDSAVRLTMAHTLGGLTYIYPLCKIMDPPLYKAKSLL